MKKIFLLILLFCLPFLLAAQQIDVKHLTLNLSFDWQKKQAKGTAELTIAMLQASNKIALDAAFLGIQSISANKQNLQFQYKGDNTAKNLEIALDKTYKANEVVKLTIVYHTKHENRADPNAIWGSFGKGLRFQQPTSTTPTKRKQIWSSGQPDGNSYWFPCNLDIADLHTTEIITTVEKPLQVISNGNLSKTIDNQDNTRTFYYQTDQPFPSYLVSIVVGEYTNVMQKSGSTIINNFGYPHEKEAVAATVELLPDMMKFLETKTGYAYPFKTYSQVVVQDYPFPGLVGQHSATLLSDNYIDDYGVHKDFKYLWDGVAMQALANQWFGNLIMPKSWNDVWLNNAFAQYFAGLYTAKSNGNAEYLLWYYPFEKGAVMGDWNGGNIHPIVPKEVPNDKIGGFATDTYSKFRGALVLRMLADEMGEENWWKTVQHFVKNNAYKQVSTKDFQNSVEKVSGKSYQWFFDQWFYKIGLPKFEVTTTYNAAAKQLALVVKQVQSQENKTIYEQVAYFEGKINVEIDGKIETIVLKPQQENTFQFGCPTAPAFVNFNVEQTFFCETTFKKSQAEYLAQLPTSKDAFAKRDALNNLVTIANDSTTTLADKTKIMEVLSNEVKSKLYWRQKMVALGALSRISAAQNNEKVVALLKEVIQNETGWLKSTAVSILGNSADAAHTDLYISLLKDESDRVINSAANALGKTKSPKAFAVLMNLEKHPSWKNQSRISALNGLQNLGDANATDYALKCLADKEAARWYLATPVWDYPFAAVNTLVALGKAELGYTMLLERLKKSLPDNDLNDIFQNVQLINLLKDARAKEIYPLLKDKFKEEATVLEAITNYENQFLESLK